MGGAEVAEPRSMSRSGSEGGVTPQRSTSLGMTPAGSGATDEELSDGTASEPESPSATSPSRRYFSRHKPLDHMQVRGVEPRSSAPIVAERVSTHGRITPMEPDSEVQALDPKLRTRVGRIRSDGPIGRWLEKRAQWDARWPDRLAKYRDIRARDRAQAEKQGFLTGTLQGEHPPPSALAGMANPELARKVGKSVDEPTSKTTVPVLLWSSLASKRDAEAAEKDERDERDEKDESEKEGKEGGGTLARIISGKPARDDGGSSRAESERALARGVEDEDRKMSTAGQTLGTVAAGTAVVTSVAAAPGAPAEVGEVAPHTRTSLDGERGAALSRVSTNASEYVLASEVVDSTPEANGDVRETVVTQTIAPADASAYDTDGVSGVSGVHATDYATAPAASEKAGSGEPEPQSHLSGTTATPSALPPATATSAEKPPTNGTAPAEVVEKTPAANGVDGDEKTNGVNGTGEKLTTTGKKGVSDEYVDMPRKGVMGKLCC